MTDDTSSPSPDEIRQTRRAMEIDVQLQALKERLGVRAQTPEEIDARIEALRARLERR